MSEPADETNWDQRGLYVCATGPVLLVVTERPPPWDPNGGEGQFQWKATVTAARRDMGTKRDAVRTAEGFAGSLDGAKHWAARAAVLQWMLLALETGIQPPSFSEDKNWLYELRNALDYERWAWGVASRPRENPTDTSEGKESP